MVLAGEATAWARDLGRAKGAFFGWVFAGRAYNGFGFLRRPFGEPGDEDVCRGEKMGPCLRRGDNEGRGLTTGALGGEAAEMMFREWAWLNKFSRGTQTLQVN